MSRVFAYKSKAALSSFALFTICAVLLTAAVYFLWYPGYLFWLDGGLQGLKIVWLVDLILGPVVAFIIFHPDKERKKIILDVSVVLSLQLSAMLFGAYQIYKERPIAVVYGDGRLITVASGIMALQYESESSLSRFSRDGNVPMIYRREPTSLTEKKKQAALLFQHGIHREAQAWLFAPFTTAQSHLRDRSDAVVEYLEKDKVLASELEKWCAKGEKCPYTAALFEGRWANAALLFNQQYEVVGWLRIDDELLPTLAPTNTASVH